MADSVDAKRVKDVMLPLEKYVVVQQDATLREALLALRDAQRELPADRQPYRGILAVDDEGRIVGKAGQLAFLKALEPKYSVLGDLRTLARAGVTSEFVSAMMESLEFWQDSISVNCARASSMRVKDFMIPATESIDENALLTEAIHTIVVWQTLSVLVTRQGEIVGILRLSDLFAEIAGHICELHD